MRIFDLLTNMLQKFPKADALSSKVNGEWIKISTQEYVNHANWVSSGLLSLGLKKGDAIATVSNNRYEWNFMDMGMLQVGAVHVPMYPTISESDYKFILNDCQAKAIVVSDADLLKKIENIKKDVPSLQFIFTFNDIEGARSWKEIIDLGKKNNHDAEIEELKKSISDQELATLIYTSGTTGVPKGVMLSHANLMTNTIGSSPLMPPSITHESRALSFLPLCHVYERMVGYLYHHFGVSIYYAESLEKIADNLKELKPNLFVTVPRLLEKVYDKIMAKGAEQTGIKHTLFFWAVTLGLKYEHYGRNGWWYELKLKLARKLIFSKWHEALGGNIKVIVSGGAPLQPRLAKVFWAANLPVLEGYGLTETSPVIAVNTLLPEGACFGTVGKKIDNVEVKLAADGEILCKGPNVMMGYYKRPDLTAEVMEDGWFKTGDIGEWVDGKYIKITDRKKELLKTSGGKYIAPAPLENKMKESQFIEQIIVVGDNQKFAGALIVPAFGFAKEWLEKKGITTKTNDDIAASKEIFEAIRLDIELFNRDFSHVDQIKKFVLLPREFTLANNEMTPKLSLRRKVIQEHYKNEIESMYSAS